jgi:SAM-dependent methyltransferase
LTERARSFGAAADGYALARPSYPEEAVRFVLPRVPCAVADVGAGTGKLTEALLRLGCDVVAVEPDDAMRARIAGADARAGTAEDVPLEAGSVDAVVAGSAFHWFDAPRFVDEAVRVLRPGGTVGIVGNDWDDRVDWVAELGDLVEPGARLTFVEPAPPFEDGRFGPGELLEVPHGQRLDARLLVELVASTSRMIVRPQDERAALLANVERFARSRFGDGGFAFPYVARAWRYERR